jgi:glutamate-1-semialdehyde 2,1-aminomutase
VHDRTDWHNADVGGVGGTLAGNALSLAAMRVTLDRILTDDAFARMIDLGARFEHGVRDVIGARGLPWHVVRLGCRVGYLFRPDAPRTGAEAAAGQDEQVDAFIHLYLLNRGILMTPFNNMGCCPPATTAVDVDRHPEVYDAMAAELTG